MIFDSQEISSAKGKKWISWHCLCEIYASFLFNGKNDVPIKKKEYKPTFIYWVVFFCEEQSIGVSRHKQRWFFFSERRRKRQTSQIADTNRKRSVYVLVELKQTAWGQDQGGLFCSLVLLDFIAQPWALVVVGNT
jgi:hypothetical protein